MADNTWSPKSSHSITEKTRKPKSRFSRRNRRRLWWCFISSIVVGGVVWHYGSPHFYRWKARDLLQSDPAAAALLLEQDVLGTRGSSPEAEVLWAHALLKTGRWVEALGAFSQIKHLDAVDSTLLVDLAEEAMELKAYPLAGLASNAVRSDATERARALEVLLMLAEREGNSFAVLDLVDEMDRMHMSRSKTGLLRARALEQLMDLPAAAIAYETALESSETNEENTQILRALTRIYIQLARPEDARMQLNRLLKESTMALSADDRLSEARLQRLEGNIAEARTSLEEVLRSGRTDSEVLELRATLAMDSRDYRAAVSDLQIVLSEQPWNKQAHYKLAQGLMKCGREDEAVHHLSENRRLLELSNRIVLLRKKANRTPEETDELIRAMEASGMKATAAQMRQRLHHP